MRAPGQIVEAAAEALGGAASPYSPPQGAVEPATAGTSACVLVPAAQATVQLPGALAAEPGNAFAAPAAVSRAKAAAAEAPAAQPPAALQGPVEGAVLPSERAGSSQLGSAAQQLAAVPAPPARAAATPAAAQAASELTGREQAAPGELTEDSGGGHAVLVTKAAADGPGAPHAQPAAGGSDSCARGSWAATSTAEAHRALKRAVAGTADALGAGAAAEPCEGLQQRGCVGAAHVPAGKEAAPAASSSAGEAPSALPDLAAGLGATVIEAAPAADASGEGAGEPGAAAGFEAAPPEAAPGIAAPADVEGAPEAALADAALRLGCGEQLAADGPAAGRAAVDGLPASAVAGAEGPGCEVGDAEPLAGAVAADSEAVGAPAAAVDSAPAASGVNPVDGLVAADSDAASALAASEQPPPAAVAAEPEPVEVTASAMDMEGEPVAGAEASGADGLGAAQLLVLQAAPEAASSGSGDAVDSPKPAAAAELMADAGGGDAAMAAPAAPQPDAALAAGEPQPGAVGDGEPACGGQAAEGVLGAPALTPRKRGRPPKSAAAGAPGTLDPSSAAAEAGSPAPRKRGRPPKSAAASTPATLDPDPAEGLQQAPAAGDGGHNGAPEGAVAAGNAGAPADEATWDAAHKSAAAGTAPEPGAATAAGGPVRSNAEAAHAALACSGRAARSISAAAAPAPHKPGRPPKAAGASAPAALPSAPAGAEGQHLVPVVRASGDDLGRTIADAHVVETAEAARVVWARVRGYPFWPVRAYSDDRGNA